MTPPQDPSLGDAGPAINVTSYMAQFPLPITQYAWYGGEANMSGIDFVNRDQTTDR